jgi:hypothetical protein
MRGLQLTTVTLLLRRRAERRLRQEPRCATSASGRVVVRRDRFCWFVAKA